MKNLISFVLIASVLFVSCKKDETNNEELEEEITHDTSSYILNTGFFPNPNIPEDNLLTVQKIELGKMLFYEPMLSKDGSQNCAECHVQADGFSDSRRFSVGVEGLDGKRQAMPIFNMAWHDNKFFWDGRANLLRDQALMPIQDPLEMNETLENVVGKLNQSKIYKDQFIRAFGDDEITEERLGLAMEQFMMSIVSMNSKYDRFLLGEASLNESESRGKSLFFTEFDPTGQQKGGECFHCHAGVNFTNNLYMNNGLDSDGEFLDEGVFKVTSDPMDLAKFKVPSLRNIAMTAPYMHDGRFETLDEVLTHYNSEVKASTTLDDAMNYNLDPGLQLNVQDIADLKAFLLTLSDDTYLNNQEYASPFEK